MCARMKPHAGMVSFHFFLLRAISNKKAHKTGLSQNSRVHSLTTTITNITLSPMQASSLNISKKRKFVADGVFFAELNEMLVRELAEDGYSGVEVRSTPVKMEIIIRATKTQNVLGEKGRRIRELTSLVQKRFGFAEGAVELYAEKVANRGLCAISQCESLRYKLLGGLAVRRACYGVLRFIMETARRVRRSSFPVS